ncbi:MAG: putative nucleotidyltransferase substrate binding domain-containing protein [Pseudomonadota bacterium]
MGDFPLPRIRDLIHTVVPFDTLSEEDLTRAVSRMEIAYFPRGQVIIRAGDAPAKFLHIISSGSVKVTLPDDSGGELLIDLRGEGDCFGAVSLLQGAQALFEVTAREDVIAFLLPGEHFRQLVDSQPAFKRHFSFSLARNIQASRRTEPSVGSTFAGGQSLGLDAMLGRSQVSELMTSEVLCCPPLTTIQQAARLMTAARVGSIVVREETGLHLGILTDTDLRSRVLAEGLDTQAPVHEVMSRPPRSIDTKAYAFEAMLEMIRHRVHHLVVTEGERMVGVISDHDVRVITGSAPVGVMRDLDKIHSFDQLDLVHQNLDPVLEKLLRLGGSAEYMLELATEFNDRLTLKILELSELEMASQGLGRAPVPYAWLALGSAGRREQALRTPQHSCLVFSWVPQAQQAEVKTWFVDLAGRVVERLVRCGFPLGREGLLASSRAWCHSDSWWYRTYLDLIQETDRCALPEAGPLFDLRGVHEEMAFAETLRLHVSEAMDGNRQFLARMARVGFHDRPPLGFLRDYVVDKRGQYQDQLDLRSSGLQPLVRGARVLALEQGLTVTNTLTRLAELASRGVLNERFASDLRAAFSFITLLRISRHLEARAAGREPDGFVNPASLNAVQRKMLKESFAVISQLQEFMEQRYRAQMVA